MADFTDNFSQYAISKLPTFRDDFLSYANVTEGDLAWASTDTSRVRVNPTNDNLDFNMNLVSTNLAIAHDLGVGNVSNERWVLQAKINFTTLSADTNTRIYIGLSDSSQTTAINGNADRIMAKLQFSTGTKAFECMDTDGTGEVAVDDTVAFTFLTGVDYYLTVQRDSFQSYHVEVFTDKSRTISLGRADGVCVPTTQDLRFIVIQNVNAGVNTTMTGTIDDVEFWGKPSTFQDDFSTALNWVQTGTGVSITGGEISGWGADGTDRRLTHDLGKPLSDTNWKAEFEYMFTASSIPAHVPLIITDINQDADAGTNDNDFIGVVHGTSVNELKIVGGDSDDLGGAGFGSTGIPIVTSTAYFPRLERLSSTETRLSVFSDSARTTHIASSPVTLTIPSTIDGLRFVHSQNLSGGGASRNLTGTLDNLVISDPENILEGAQQGDETFQDNFSFDKGWTLTGAGVAITGGILDYPYQGDGTTQGASFDLGAGNISDDNWVMRFKLVIADISGTPASDAISVAYGIADIQTESSNTSVDGLHFGINKSSATGDKFVLFNTNGALPIQGSATNETEFTETPVAGTFYIELKRESLTLGRATIYSDAKYTDVIETQTVTTSSSVTALRFINYTGRLLNRAGVIETEIDNVEFYNGVSVALTPIKERIDFEDNFVEDNWTDQGTGFSVNTSTQAIDWDAQIDGAVNGTWIDILGKTISDTKWSLRWKHIIDNLTVGAIATVNEVHFAISDLDGTNGTNTAQDAIGFRHIIGNPGGGGEPQNFNIYDKDGATLPQGVTDAEEVEFTITPTVGTFYMELKRTSATTYEMNIYSDPDYSELIEQQTGTCLATTQSLRFLKVMCRENNSGGDSTLDGTIDKVQFWDGNNPTEHGTKWVEVNIT